MFKIHIEKARLLAALVVFGVLGSMATAQSLQPIDPLQRPKSGAGSASYSVSGGYNPQVLGNTISVGGGLGLTGTYNVTERLAVTASTGFGASRTETVDDAGAVTAESNARWNGLNVGAQYTFGGRYAPALGLAVDLPLTGNGWGVTGSASASLLRDPVILDGTLAATYQVDAEGTGTPIVSAGAGVGFVVNDAVTLRADATQNLSFGTLTLPSSSLGFGGAYKLNEKSSVSARAVLNLVGARSSTGLNISYLYRP